MERFLISFATDSPKHVEYGKEERNREDTDYDPTIVKAVRTLLVTRDTCVVGFGCRVVARTW